MDSLLLESAEAIIRAKDGDVGPLIMRLRKLALKLAEDPVAFGEINCAADLLEAAQKQSARGRPELLSTEILRELVRKFVTARMESEELQSLTNRQRSGRAHREAAERYGIT